MGINTLVGKMASRFVTKKLNALGIPTVPPGEDKPQSHPTNTPLLEPIQISKWSFFIDLILGKDIGLAKSYIQGKWDHADLTSLFRHLANHNSAPRSLTDLLAVNKHIAKLFQRIRSTNSIWWASKNIRFHYDLGNDFFSEFLDQSMTYSCAIFDNTHSTLLEAQQKKISTLLDKANLKEGDHILDIGCGWGGLIFRAVDRANVTAAGVTLSEQQHLYIEQLIQEKGVTEKATAQLIDYRLVEGQFQHIFSVEMLEAVGHKGIGQFFQHSAYLLDETGTLQIQVITVPDDRYDVYRNNCDFIQKFIFPGGLLPSLGTLHSAAAQSGFILSQSESIGHHYATTLRHWKSRMRHNKKKLLARGYNQEDLRRFEYYFSYCEGAFLADHIQTHQLTYIKN